MPRVSEEHRASRREQILAAGWRCVAREGFHKTSMADVIRESGLSAGAVYLYFRSKDEIIAAIAEQVVAGADQIFDEVLARDPLPQLHETVRLIVTRIERIATAGDGELVKVALPTWAEAVRNEAIRGVVAQAYRHLRQRMQELVERLQAAGKFDADANPEQVAQVLFGLMPGFVLQRVILGDITAESYATGLADLIRGGCGGTTTPASRNPRRG
jgi:AcrR family transcriptional regulator